MAAPERLTAKVDFPAFYVAGRIVNEHPQGALYDQELQLKLYKEIAPSISDGQVLYFAYTPFLAFLFSPLARLPYSVAFILWILVSLAMFTAGFGLAWNAANLPRRMFLSGLVIALSFLPFFAWCVLAGQTTAFGFLFLALAVYLDQQGRAFFSGLALAMLLYKPPLLVLILPMLVITKRWRSLEGFLVGGLFLGAVSLAAIGFSGIGAYREMLARFSVLKVTGRQVTGQEVDALSFFLALTGSYKIGLVLFIALIAFAAPFLVRAWRQAPAAAWPIAITGSIVLNVYVLLYDATLLIVPVVLMVGAALRENGSLPIDLRWLMFALFLMPWVETHLASKGVLPLTIAILAFGYFQVRFAQGVTALSTTGNAS